MLRFLLLFFLLPFQSIAQNKIDSFRILGDVKITIDAPVQFNYKKSILILYALPNGNTTAQTMGKKMNPGDDWHYDIQHIAAQTAFLRNQLHKNLVVAYLENDFRSWPLWKQKHADYKMQIRNIVDSLGVLYKGAVIYMSGHSGGGSFIFGYLEGANKIPAVIERITFLDSNYGYDSSYFPKLESWLRENKLSVLTVFAYNDSIALYNGKPVVSEKGGTWYRSHLMLEHFSHVVKIQKTKEDSLVVYTGMKKKLGFFLLNNPERKILHTEQVVRNGFIHSVLYRTKKEGQGYEYYGQRVFSDMIR